MMASSLGKMPTTSVRRLISRSSGLVDFRLVILREGHEGQDISLGFIPERGKIWIPERGKIWHLGTQPRGRLFLVERAGGRRAAEGVCEASKRSGRADDWQDLKGGRDEVR